QAPAAGIGGVASAPASAGQSDALRGPSPSGVGEQSDSVFTGGTWLSGGEGNQFPGIGARPLRRWAATVSLSGLRRQCGGKSSIPDRHRAGASVGFAAVWGGGLEMPGAGPLYWMAAGESATPSWAGGQQQPFSDPAVGESASLGELGFGPSEPAAVGGLAGQVRPLHCARGD